MTGVTFLLLEPRLVTHAACEIVERRTNVLTDERRYDHQNDTGHRHHACQFSNGQSRHPHDGYLAVAGEPTQSKQCTNQCRHRQHFKCNLGKTQYRIQECLQHAVVAHLVIKFADKLKQSRKREQHQQHQQCADQNRTQKVAAQNTHHVRLNDRIRRCMPF